MTRLPPIAADRRWVGLVCLTAIGLAQAGTMLVAAFATRDVISALRSGQAAPPAEALTGLIAAGALMFALRSIEGAVAERAGQSFASAIRRRLFLHMSRLPVSTVTERRAGAMALRYVGDLGALKGWVSKGLARLISAAMTVPAAFLILYLLHPALAVGAAAPIAGALLAILCLGRPLAGAHADLRAQRARLAASMAERLPQALALRRSGRLNTELRRLAERSKSIALAATYRAWLTETVRALPDIASGVAGAICLWICFVDALPVEDAVAALTALALVSWPLRRLADVSDRHKAFVVAAAKLEATLSAKTMRRPRSRTPRADAPVLEISALRLTDCSPPVSFAVQQGQTVRLTGLSGSGKSRLLAVAAGLDRAPTGRVSVLGLPPVAVAAGRVLYLGRFSPHLKGTLRRACTLGLARPVEDAEIRAAFDRAGLMGVHDRLGGLSGQVAEGRRNLTSTECSGILLIRGLLAKAELALLDADEIGLKEPGIALLLEHFARHRTATVIVSSEGLPRAHIATTIQMAGQERLEVLTGA
ncbi:MAG: ABC transporter transmembrane domain-containing protein [Pseudomonadota bacterium]